MRNLCNTKTKCKNCIETINVSYKNVSDAHTHALISPYEARLYNKIGKKRIVFAYFYSLLCKYLHILFDFVDFCVIF
ncbi:hypothetical protein [Helicobacter sp. MIT 01-3238]|uniref:hypothetical protein n=1 Tax=Helicobacter sp. MIT 01-3238 TaxID=398627 RepID=UPI000E1EF8CE|nr:hypothetical protein [Helicobacter sp. MIT 01-3238]RDU53421.1 hypothetical protein CQA40_05575 [Helicobacter sp. MIT 01-3238]